MSHPLNAKQQRFVAEYLINLNATQAAVRAGYSAKTAHSIGPRLLDHVGISAAIAQGKAKQLEKADLSAVRILEELRRLALSDARGLFDVNGNLKPIHELTDEQAASIASVEVVKKNLTTGDGEIDTVVKVKVWDKPRSLEMLAKHFGLLVEQVNHGGVVTVQWKD